MGKNKGQRNQQQEQQANNNASAAKDSPTEKEDGDKNEASARRNNAKKPERKPIPVKEYPRICELLVSVLIALCAAAACWGCAISPAFKADAVEGARTTLRVATLGSMRLATGAVFSWTETLPAHASNRTHAWALGVAEARLQALLDSTLEGSTVTSPTLSVTMAVADARRLLAEGTSAGPAVCLAPATPTPAPTKPGKASKNKVDKAAEEAKTGSSARCPGVPPADASPRDVLATLVTARKETAETEANSSLAARAKRFFSLVNIAYALGTVGLLITTIPVLYLAYDFFRDIFKTFEKAVKVILIALWNYLLTFIWRPWIILMASAVLVRAADESVAFETRVYTSIVAGAVVTGLQFMAIGQLESIVLEHYPALTERRRYERWDNDKKAYVEDKEPEHPFGVKFLRAVRTGVTYYTLLYPSLVLIPLAHTLGRQVIGFAAVAAAYGFTRFIMFAFWGGYFFGFQDEDSHFNSALLSIILTSALVLTRAYGGTRALELLAPYSAGLNTFSAAVGYLALLITAHEARWRARWSYRGDDEGAATRRRKALIAEGSQILFLIAGVVVGTLVPGLAGLRNTALVYVYLWFMDMTWYVSSPSNVFFAGFLVSLMTAWGAHRLHTNPEVASSLLAGVMA